MTNTNPEPDIVTIQQFSGDALVLNLSANRKSRDIVVSDEEMVAAEMMIELNQRKRLHESMKQLYADINCALSAAVNKAPLNILYGKILAAATVAAIAILGKDPALKCVVAGTDHACPARHTVGTDMTYAYSGPCSFLDDLCADLGGTYEKIE